MQMEGIISGNDAHEAFRDRRFGFAEGTRRRLPGRSVTARRSGDHAAASLQQADVQAEISFRFSQLLGFMGWLYQLVEVDHVDADTFVTKRFDLQCAKIPIRRRGALPGNRRPTGEPVGIFPQVS